MQQREGDFDPSDSLQKLLEAKGEEETLYAKLMCENEELNAQISSKKAEYQELKAKLDLYRTQKDSKLQKEAEDLQEELSKVDNLINSLKKRNLELEALNKELKRKSVVYGLHGFSNGDRQYLYLSLKEELEEMIRMNYPVDAILSKRKQLEALQFK